MKIDCIEKAIESGMTLHTWDDKESSGLWLALADDKEDLADIQLFSSKGLEENVWLKNFAHSRSDDLTIVLADSLEIGLEIMDAKLKEMPSQIYDPTSSVRQDLRKVFRTISDNL